ncbi:MAG: glucosaminidase domain-containing protein [Bacteroidota bacterium]|nr:glucosaminidase domain-containing protein [Bacteroidota bacterium]
MKNLSRILFILLLLPSNAALYAQPSERKSTPADYIDKYKDDAVREMQMYKVPASITLAQGMLESDNGNSALAVYANNHFGIKCHKEWTGDTYTADDDEHNECFRKYPSVYESFVDHSKFLKNRERYSALFTLKITDYKGWAKGLKAAGYATDPRYAERLIDIIERYKLFVYDKEQAEQIVTTNPKNNTGEQGIVTATGSSRREVFLNNKIKYIVVKPGDSFMKIAKELDMGVWQLYKYNDLNKNAVLTPGQLLYIQPKKKKSKEGKHIVKPGETIYDISQHYGVKVKCLYKYNSLPLGAQPKAGETLLLKKKR